MLFSQSLNVLTLLVRDLAKFTLRFGLVHQMFYVMAKLITKE